MTRSAFGPAADHDRVLRQQIADDALLALRFPHAPFGPRSRLIDAGPVEGRVPTVTTVAWPDPDAAERQRIPEPPGPWIDPAWWERAITGKGDA